MQITKCDKCKKEEGRYRWVELRFAEGFLAEFFGYPDRKIELCYQCFKELFEENEKW